ncbi:MAG: TolC family protein [Anaeromyxobacter sp.]|nr:TolC family protein [Anaeromyxobacter sp.]
MNSALLLAAALAAVAQAGPSPAAPPPAGAAAELTLADALAELDLQSPTLAQARARADEASALVRQAASGLLPTLTASGGYTRHRDDAVMDVGRLLASLPVPPATLPPPIIIQPLEVFSGTLAVRVPLLVPSAWFDLAAARAGARSAAATAEATRRSLRAALAVTAHLGLAAEEAVAATERAEANAARLAESAERRVTAGTAAPLEPLRARTEQVKRQGDLVRARATLAQARLAAGTLLGRGGAVRILVEGEEETANPDPTATPNPNPNPTSTPTATQTPNPNPTSTPTPIWAPTPTPPLPEHALVEEALAHRPELAASAALIDSAESQVSSAWARLAPQLSLSGAAFAADVAYPTGERDGWRLGVDLTWPLYDGGLRYGKRREALARLAQARAGEAAQRLLVGQEARDAARDEAVAVERLRLAVEQRRLAAEAGDTAQRSYQAGVLSSLDVLDASDRLYAADIGLADARARLAAARVALARALGRGP